MPLQIWDNSQQGWRGVRAIRVDGADVMSVSTYVGSSWVYMWRRDPYIFEITSNTTLHSPSWALYADIIIIGGGGGGAGGNGANNNPGRGGKSGEWRGVTRAVRPGEELDFTIGLAGSGGQTESGSGGTGGTTKFVHMNFIEVALGGEGGIGTNNSSTANGEDAGSFTHDDWQVTGGIGGSLGELGRAPGGGGGGGKGGLFGRWSKGNLGSRGGAWVRFRSA